MCYFYYDFNCFKVLILAFNAFFGLGPTYLQDHLFQYVPQRALHFINKHLLVIPTLKEVHSTWCWHWPSKTLSQVKPGPCRAHHNSAVPFSSSAVPVKWRCSVRPLVQVAELYQYWPPQCHFILYSILYEFHSPAPFLQHWFTMYYTHGLPLYLVLWKSLFCIILLHCDC